MVVSIRCLKTTVHKNVVSLVTLPFIKLGIDERYFVWPNVGIVADCFRVNAPRQRGWLFMVSVACLSDPSLYADCC